MNNFLKTAFVAAGVVGTVGAVSTAEAASFNVVVDKITMYTDQNDVTTGSTVYDPANNVGESATRTIDLFNSTAKLGTSLNLATPPAGTYETILLEISEIEVSGTTAALDMKTSLAAAGVGTVVGGNLILPLGTVVTGEALDAAYGGALDTAVVSAPATTVSGVGYTLPKLNILLDETLVDEDAATSAALLGGFPEVHTIKTSTTDNTDIANLLLEVDVLTSLPTYAAGAASGTDPITVGLFTSAKAKKPVQYATISAADAAQTAAATYAEVELVDPPQTTFIPVVWHDANSNNELDTGEEYAVKEGMGTLVANNFYDFATDIAGEGAVVSGTAITDGTLTPFDAVGGTFGTRSISLTIALPDTTNQTDISGGAINDPNITLTNGSGTVAASTSASVSIVYQIASGISKTATTFDVASGGTGTNGNDIEFALTDLTAFDSVSNVSFVSNTTDGQAGTLSVLNVPFEVIDTFDDGDNTGEFTVAFELRGLVDNAAGAVDPGETVFTEADGDQSSGDLDFADGSVVIELND